MLTFYSSLTRRAWALAALGISCVTPSKATGQDASILSAAARYVISAEQSTSIGLEPRILPYGAIFASPGSTEWKRYTIRDSTVVASLARQVRAIVVLAESAYVCEPSAADCDLLGIQTLLGLGKPDIRGRSATIRVFMWTRNTDPGALHKVGASAVELILEEGQDGWHVVRTGRRTAS